MGKVAGPWSIQPDGAEYVEFRRYKALVARNKKAEVRRIRVQKLLRLFRSASLAMLVAVASFAVPWVLLTLKPWTELSSSPWTPEMQARHYAAYPNCAAARAVGLAPAFRGQPGYWPQHDRDGDGWACEPYPRGW